MPLTPFAICRHDLLGLPGFDVFGPAAALTEAVWERLTPAGATWPEVLWNRLTEAGAAPAGREAFEMLRIEAGTPAFGPDVDENTFAPEVGRAAQAVSYTKGCYLGQEPIVMARDRGQVNRTLLGLKLTGGPAPHGSLVYRDGKEVGRVTSERAVAAAGADRPGVHPPRQSGTGHGRRGGGRRGRGGRRWCPRCRSPVDAVHLEN